MEIDRQLKQKVFIRVCRDSNWQMSAFEAAKFAGEMLKISPLEVYTAFGYLSLMEEIAAGKHLACKVSV